MPISPMSSPEGSPSREGRPDKADLLTQESPSDEAKKAGVQGPPPASTTPFGSPSPSPFKTSQPSPALGRLETLRVNRHSNRQKVLGYLETCQLSHLHSSLLEGLEGLEAQRHRPHRFQTPKPATVSAFGSSSAFGPGGSGTPAPSTNPGSTTPTFGSPSAVGSGPVFGKSTLVHLHLELRRRQPRRLPAQAVPFRHSVDHLQALVHLLVEGQHHSLMQPRQRRTKVRTK